METLKFDYKVKLDKMIVINKYVVKVVYKTLFNVKGKEYKNGVITEINTSKYCKNINLLDKEDLVKLINDVVNKVLSDVVSKSYGYDIDVFPFDLDICPEESELCIITPFSKHSSIKSDRNLYSIMADVIDVILKEMNFEVKEFKNN